MESPFKRDCVALRKSGHTLTEIVQITGRAKTTVFFHIQSIPLPVDKQIAMRHAAGERIRGFALARKGKSARGFRKIEEWTPDAVLLVGHLLFDGEIGERRCAYHNRSSVLIERVRFLMEKELYDFSPTFYLNKEAGVQRISYNNVALSTYVQELSLALLKSISTLSLENKRAFLKAFFDDEGCMDYKPKRNKRCVRGYQKNTATLHLIQSLLVDFNIGSRVVLPNEVIITGKLELIKFQKEINFSPGVRINGNRSNSVWKEHLEKRDLLERAIQSFKT